MDEIKLIQKAVWSFVKSHTDIEYEEAFAEACLAYLENAKKFNPSRGQLSTFIWRLVTNRLTNIFKSTMRRNNKEFPITEITFDEYDTPERLLIAREDWEELITSLSPEAQSIYWMIMNEESLEELSPKKTRGKLARNLRDAGWSHGTIWDSFREIKQALAV